MRPSGHVQSGTGRLSDAVESEGPTSATALSFPPKRKRRRRGKHIYAHWATMGEIIVPRLPPLGYLKQSRLITLAQSGDLIARDIVWEHNARLAYSVINKFRTRPDLMADLFQEAQFGLARAIRRFDVSRLLEFSTYAFAAMSRGVTRHRALPGCAARVSAAVIAPYLTFRARVAHAQSRADWFDVREKYLSQAKTLYQRMVRLHALTEAQPLAEARAVPGAADTPDARLLGRELAADLASAIALLDARQRYIVEHRHGLNDRPTLKLDEIGAEHGLTKERVRQIQMSAEAAIRAYLTERGWDTGLVPLASLS